MEKEQNVIPVNLDFNAKIHNRFDIEVCDAKTGEVKQRAQAFNVICDALWTRLFNGNTYFNYIIYGSGTGTPAATDTTLFNRINSVNVYNTTVSTTGSGRDKILSYQKKITLDENTSNGKTITEVGIGYDSTHIATHAMLQDMNGNPISITKTNTDIIYIYATIYIHYFAYSISENSFIVYSIDENTSTMLSQIAGTRSWSEDRTHYILFSPGVMFAQRIFDNDPQSAYNFKLGTVSFNPSTKTMTESVRLLSGEGNYGIVSTAFNSGGVIFDVSKSYNLNAFAITGESIGTGDGSTNTFKSKFPINSSAKVYVDGVEQASGITILEGPFKEFHKLHKFYNTSGYLVFPQLRSYSASNYFIIENDINATFTGLCYVKGDSDGINTTIYGSDDSIAGPWTSIASSTPGGTGTKTISFPNATNYRYYKITLNQGDYRGHVITNFFLISPSDKTYNIVFDTPPASNSIITIDYIPNCIPKDSNHVLDLTFSITLGEYSGN